MLTVEEAAGVLGISRTGAYELAHSADFPHMCVGKRILIPRDKFLEWIELKCQESTWGN